MTYPSSSSTPDPHSNARPPEGSTHREPQTRCDIPQRQRHGPFRPRANRTPPQDRPFSAPSVRSSPDFPPPPSQDGRKRRPEEGKQAGLMLAVSSSPFEQPVRSPCFFPFPPVFPSLFPPPPPSALSLPFAHCGAIIPPHPRRSVNVCDCYVCRFSLLNSVIIIRPKRSSSPIYRRSISQIAGRSVSGTEDFHRQCRDRPAIHLSTRSMVEALHGR